MRHPLLLLFVLMLSVLPMQAEPEHDTVTALAEAVIPPRDRIDLAQRLLGVTEIAPPPATSPQWRTGDVKSFWVSNSAEDLTFQVDASLRTTGEHITFWVEEGVQIDPAAMEELARIFDNDIYDQMHHLFGSEDSPGIDGDPRVYGLFTYGQGPGTAAYFYSQHINPVEAVPTSNEHEMFFFNLDNLGIHNADTGLIEFDPALVAGVVAHEFQHMIHEHQDNNEEVWLNEGLSKFAEIYTGFQFGSNGTALMFLSQPDLQLNTWPEDGSTLPHYGAGMMFASYFYDRYGEDALRTLVQHPANGLKAFDMVLADLGAPGVDAFFADWVLANFLLDPRLDDGRYGYRSLSGLVSPRPAATLSELPYQHEDTAHQYGTDYIAFNNPGDDQALEISIDMPETVQLVPAAATSGQRMWYSNKADNSDTTLTRRFDLSQVDSATLNFNVWYHIENLWDYGYVMVSTDDGATWTILDTPHKTSDNPHHTSYGPGYTGASDGWLAESISLDDYAGQEILLRFEMITDDATTQPGMLIDDVRIPEIDYASDFEAGDGGWQAQGWVWTDNTLPQNVWVQAVQRTRDDVHVTRWQANAETTWILPLEPDVEQVVIAVSPFAPLTTVTMPYTLTVSAVQG